MGVGDWRAVVSSKVSAYPLVPFAVSAGAAAGASAIQLASEYPRWPLADLRFGWRWSAIAGLDAVAGIAALAIVHALGWSKSRLHEVLHQLAGQGVMDLINNKSGTEVRLAA